MPDVIGKAKTGISKKTKGIWDGWGKLKKDLTPEMNEERRNLIAFFLKAAAVLYAFLVIIVIHVMHIRQEMPYLPDPAGDFRGPGRHHGRDTPYRHPGPSVGDAQGEQKTRVRKVDERPRQL